MSLPARAFDLVIAHACLHHVRKLDHALRQVAQTLRPDGSFLVYDNIGKTRATEWLEGRETLIRRLWRLLVFTISLPLHPIAHCRRIASFFRLRLAKAGEPFVPAPTVYSPFELVSSAGIPSIVRKYFEVDCERQLNAFVKFWAAVGVSEGVPRFLLHPAVALLTMMDHQLTARGCLAGENILMRGKARPLQPTGGASEVGQLIDRD